jgi:hypothetical protein
MSLSSIPLKTSSSICAWKNKRIVDIRDNNLYSEYAKYQNTIDISKYKDNQTAILEGCFNVNTEPSKITKICTSSIPIECGISKQTEKLNRQS